MDSDSPASSPSSSTSSTSTSSPRPCLLLALPLEVLSGIVKLCAEQDQAFKHRVACIRQTSDLWTPLDVSIQKVIKQHEYEGFGRSVNGLFQTCRVLSNLAAPFVFHTLKASRAIKNKSYRYNIAPRYLQLFQHIHFDDASDLIGLDYLAASLSSFNSLKELTLNAPSAKGAFGSEKRSLNSSSEATRMLKRISTRIRILHLHEFEADDALQYLALFDSLNKVVIRGPLPSSIKNVDKLALLLQNVEQVDLNLMGPRPNRSFSFPIVLVSTIREWPRLKFLALRVDRIDEAAISFIQLFSSSLEELEVTTCVDEEDDSDLVPFPAEVPFPRLRRISLVGSQGAARSVFEDTSTQTFPALDQVHLSYVIYNPFGFGKDDVVLDWLFDQHQFRVLRYAPPDQCFRLGDADSLREFADTYDTEVQLRDYPTRTSSTFVGDVEADQWIEDEQNSGGDLKSTQRCIEEDLERIKDYLETTLAKASESEDVSALYRLLEFLRPLELERFAMLD